MDYIPETITREYELAEEGVSEWVVKEVLEESSQVYSERENAESWGGEDGDELKYFFKDTEEESILGISVEKPVGAVRTLYIQDLAYTDTFRGEFTEASEADFDRVEDALETAEEPSGGLATAL